MYREACALLRERDRRGYCVSPREFRQDRWAQKLIGDRDLTIRRFQPTDRRAIETIVRKTGLRGRPSRDFFEDDKVVLGLFTDYYLDHEPDACLVAELDGQLCGYILGCTDTRRYERYLLRAAPLLAGRVAAGIVGLRFRRPQTYRTLWWLLSRAYREAPPVDLCLYPAHVHIGIDLAALGDDAAVAWWPVWAQLCRTLERVFVARGVRGVHGHVAEPTTQRALTRRVRVLGWRLLDERRFSLFGALTGEPYVIRAMGKELAQEPKS